MALIPESNHFIKNIYHIIQRQCLLSPHSPLHLFQKPQKPLLANLKNICIPLNRYTNPSIFKKPSYHSIWSQSHLQALCRQVKNKHKLDLCRVLLKNPYKNQNLINKCLEMGVKMMSVDSFQELYKIHEQSRLYEKKNLKKSTVQFIWNLSDIQYDLKQIKTLADYNIRIDGLYFENVGKFQNIKNITDRILKECDRKKKIKKIFIQTQIKNHAKLLDTVQRDHYFKANNIQIIAELKDYILTENFIIASKILGKNRRGDYVLADQCLHYFKGQCKLQGKVFQENGQKWLISKIDKFPCFEVYKQHEQKYLQKLY